MAILSVWAFAALPCGVRSEASGGAAVYLREGLGARSLALGNAGTAIADHADAAYWNPGRLALLTQDSFVAQTAALGEDRAWQSLGYVHPERVQDRPMAVGLSWVHFSAGSDIEARTGNRPDPDHWFSDQEQAFLGSLAVQTTSGLGLGANLKLLTHQLDDANATGYGLDLGAWQELVPGLAAGLVVQDLFSKLNWEGRFLEALPCLLRAGLAEQFAPLPLLVSVDGWAEWLPEAQQWGTLSYHAGVEYQFERVLALRLGLDQGRWTTGAGVTLDLAGWGRLSLDYALAAEKLPGAGITQWFSLALDGLPARPVE